MGLTFLKILVLMFKEPFFVFFRWFCCGTSSNGPHQGCGPRIPWTTLPAAAGRAPWLCSPRRGGTRRSCPSSSAGGGGRASPQIRALPTGHALSSLSVSDKNHDGVGTGTHGLDTRGSPLRCRVSRTTYFA